MRALACAILFVGIVGPGAMTALADSSPEPLLLPISQTRIVSGGGYAMDANGEDQDGDFETAPDFGPFVSAKSGNASVDGAQGTGGAQQNSEILDDGITATGSAFATAESYEFDAVAEGGGGSTVLVDFAITAPVQYTLSGTIGAFDNGSTYLILSRENTEVFSEFAFGPAQEVPIQSGGVLPAGTYQLEIHADGSAYADGFLFDYAFAEYNISFGLTALDSCIEPPADAVSWWPGDGDSGDIVGANPAFLMGGATYAAGQVGTGFDIPADGDSVEVNDRPNLRVTGDLTLDAWIRLADATIDSDRTIVHRGGLEDRTYSFRIDGSDPDPGEGALVFAHTSTDFVESASLLWQAGVWYHVAVVRVGDTVTLYRDGADVGSGMLIAPAFETPGLPVQIGATLDADYLRGTIDEVQLFRRALETPEIQAIFAAGTDGQCKDPRAICGPGAVNAGCGPAECLLLLNGQTGGPTRTVEAGPSTPLSLTIGEPLARQGDSQPTNACVYVWAGSPDQSDIKILPKDLGRMCFGIRVIATQLPVKTWNAIGATNKLGADDAPGPPPVIPDASTFELLSLPSGYGGSLTVTFQGIVEDECSRATQPYSVTNGFVLEIQP